MQAIRILLFGLASLGTLYYIAAMLAVGSHIRRAGKFPKTGAPPARITVLKPICGVDREAAENLSSFFTQDYPNYETRLGVLDPDDPAAAVVEQLLLGTENASFQRGSRIEGANNKVRILDNLAQKPMGDIVVVTDSDVRATPDLLSKIAAPFSDPTVGVVTCLYRGIRSESLADDLEGLYMTCGFAPGVACNASLGEIDFALGAASAVRRETLEAMGGFQSFVDYIADDFQLGKRAVEAKYKVVLSDYVAEIVLSKAGIGEIVARELRWSRTVRASRPWGHLGLIFTHGLPFAFLYWLASGMSPLGWSALISVLLIREFTAYSSARRYLGDKEFPKRAYLLPARDLLSFGVWMASYLSRSVVWRGRRLRLLNDGKMVIED